MLKITLHEEIEGNQPGTYKVKIKYLEENGTGRFIPKCTCPFYSEVFCKHSIALLLFWIHKKEEFTDIDEILKALSGKSKSELFNRIEEWITTNPDILERVISKPDSKYSSNDWRASDSHQVLVISISRGRHLANLFIAHMSVAFIIGLTRQIFFHQLQNLCL